MTIENELEKAKSETCPSTFEAVKLRVMALLTEEQKQEIANTEEILVGPRFHFTIGGMIRNEFGLWRKDAEALLCLIAAADPDYPTVLPDESGNYYVDPDGASSILIKEVWRELNKVN